MVKLLDFWAPWCGNCKAFSSTLDSVVEETGVELSKVNAEDDIDTCNKYFVTNLPTVVFLLDGREVDRINGLVSKETLLNKIKQLMQ